jgi:hypothetical protein
MTASDADPLRLCYCYEGNARVRDAILLIFKFECSKREERVKKKIKKAQCLYMIGVSG